MHPEQALKSFKRWVRDSVCIAASESGRAFLNTRGRWRGDAVRAMDKKGQKPTWIVSCEKNSRDNGVHLHALIHWHPLWPVPWDIHTTEWRDRYGVGKIRDFEWLAKKKPEQCPTERRLKIAGYMVKYSVKGHDNDHKNFELHLSSSLSEAAVAAGPGEQSERSDHREREPLTPVLLPC